MSCSYFDWTLKITLDWKRWLKLERKCSSLWLSFFFLDFAQPEALVLLLLDFLHQGLSVLTGLLVVEYFLVKLAEVFFFGLQWLGSGGLVIFGFNAHFWDRDDRLLMFRL